MAKKVREEWMTNRQLKLMPKSGIFWCNCDCRLVVRWQKCQLCGSRNNSRTNKK